MVQILKKYWYILVILILLFLIWYNFKDRYRFIERTKYEQSKVIENLRDSVNNLVEKNKEKKNKMKNARKLTAAKNKLLDTDDKKEFRENNKDHPQIDGLSGNRGNSHEKQVEQIWLY